MKRFPCIFLFFVVIITGCTDDPTSGDNPGTIPVQFECVDGMADDTYDCQNVDLVAHTTVNDLLTESLDNGTALNDVWGWTDPETGTEYALVGLVDGVAFVDLSAPSEPKVIGKLKETASVSEKAVNELEENSVKHEEKSSWRDLKVYQNHLYVISDGQPHGMQVFDLRRLREIDDAPEMFSEDYHYDGFENAHNIAINEQTGFAYAVGSNMNGGGLHIMDIQDPLDPQFVGFHSDTEVGFDSTGYVHDTQCVVYEGPDSDYQGDEICMNSSENYLVIANVTDKEDTRTIAKASYDGNGYAHQGWLTEDHRYFLLDDEYDEWDGVNTRTYIWDVSDLDKPELVGVHEAETPSIDHNQYIKGNYTYQANYTAGLRILSLENIQNGELEEVAYFDIFPENNEAVFDGAWSTYPFFDSGLVVVSGISNGLFILKPTL